MNLVSVHNNWKDDVLNIDILLGNYCNYKCWYCFPGSNTGTHKFPSLYLIKRNLAHLINYYKEHTNKKVFDIHFCGGEPTHWKQLPELIKFLKQEFNCLISMTSNGSKDIDWWKENAQYFDRIHLSCHHEFVNIIEFRNLCDYLYEQNVVVSASVMMDPNAWDTCMEIVDYLKRSRKKWTIRYAELIGSFIKYTDEQKKVLANHRARRVNLWFFWKNNKYHRSIVTALDELGKKYRLKDNELLLKRLNNFNGWECTVGVNWINVSMNGDISGTCGQTLYGNKHNYNLYDVDFTDVFKPNIQPSLCTKAECTCVIETIMPKRKVIPIYAN